MTSDELQQAVSSNADKLVALQSSVDTALNDRFRRMQGVVHEQVCIEVNPVPPPPQMLMDTDYFVSF